MIAKDKTRIAITIKPELLKEVDEMCDTIGMTRSDIISLLIRFALDENTLYLGHTRKDITTRQTR